MPLLLHSLNSFMSAGCLSNWKGGGGCVAWTSETLPSNCCCYSKMPTPMVLARPLYIEFIVSVEERRGERLCNVLTRCHDLMGYRVQLDYIAFNNICQSIPRMHSRECRKKHREQEMTPTQLAKTHTLPHIYTHTYRRTCIYVTYKNKYINSTHSPHTHTHT